jgi:hypothetical protein
MGKSSELLRENECPYDFEANIQARLASLFALDQFAGDSMCVDCPAWNADNLHCNYPVSHMADWMFGLHDCHFSGKQESDNPSST